MQHVLAKAAAALCRAETPNAQKLLASAALCLHLAAPHCPFTTRWLAQAAYQHAQPTSSSVPCSSQSYNSTSNSSSISSSRPDGEHASRGSALSMAVDGAHNSAGYEQWAAVAQLGKVEAEQLLKQQPALLAHLSSGQLFLATNYHVNMACLSLHPDELSAQQYAALRGALALLPPSMLQVLLDEQPRLQDLLEAHHKQRGSQQEQHQQQQQQPSQQDVLQRLQQQLLNTLGPVRPFQQQQQQWQQPRQHVQQQQQQWHEQSGHSLGASWQQQSHVQAAGQRRQRQRQQYHHHHHHNFQQVAEAVVTALGLQPDQMPPEDGKLSRLLRNAADQAQGSSSSSIPSSPNSSSSSSGAHFSSAVRLYTTSPSLTTAAGLALALERKAKSVSLRDKPIHDADSAAQFAQQLQHTTGWGSDEVLELLLQRPLLLWQHSTPCLPGQLFTELQQLLPALDQDDRLARLVRRQRLLLSCSSAELQGVVDVLATRLQLSQDQVAELVVKHPQLLVQPVKAMLLNVALLVGLGFTPSDLQAMAIKNPHWLTKSLRDLTVQWHFIQQVVKSSRQDLVLFPQLLTLPIKSCLGPRVLYARKRQIKLLAPSLSALVGRLSNHASEWREHKMVPLASWLRASDKKMCAAMGLNLEDYRRFKAAWGRVDGATWEQYRLSGGKGGQQLVLSGMAAK